MARVIFNRLAEDRKLEFDSTVNYSLDRTEVATTDEDRARVTPWIHYASLGLPKTPICSPGGPALLAPRTRRSGTGCTIVTIDLQGTTNFTTRLRGAPGQHRAGQGQRGPGQCPIGGLPPCPIGCLLPCPIGGLPPCPIGGLPPCPIRARRRAR